MQGPAPLSALWREGSQRSKLSPKKDGPPFCINCKGTHKTASSSCPEYIIQRRELAAYKNIPLAEARTRFRKRPADFIPNPISNIEFPPLYNPSFPLRYTLSLPLPLPHLPSSPFPKLYSRVLQPSSSSHKEVFSPLDSLLFPSLSYQNIKSLNHNKAASSFPPPRRKYSQLASSFPPDHHSLLISPHGRLPSPPLEGGMRSHLRPSTSYRSHPSSHPPPLHLANPNPNPNFYPINNPDLHDHLFSFFNALMEKFAPILKLLGLYDTVAEFLSLLLQSLSSHGPASNSQLPNA